MRGTTLFIMDFLPDTFWEWVLAVFVVMVAAVVVKFGFTFDVNQWGESKRKRLKEKLRAKCPHADLVEAGGRWRFESSFLSPFGTSAYECQRCGLVTQDVRAAARMLERYTNNPKLHVKQVKVFHKVHKKLYG